MHTFKLMSILALLALTLSAVACGGPEPVPTEVPTTVAAASPTPSVQAEMPPPGRTPSEARLADVSHWFYMINVNLEPDNVAWVYETSRSLGFVPFVSNRPLDRYVEPVP